MEQFVSGYCRALDQSRMVEMEWEPGGEAEADCAFPDCPHAGSCEIARKLRELAKAQEM